jgi:hypothetical protein
MKNKFTINKTKNEFNKTEVSPGDKLQTEEYDYKDSINLANIEVPIDLLNYHKENKVLFICGAGISKDSELPLFKGLVKDIYQKIDRYIYDFIELNENNSTLTVEQIANSKLTVEQKAELMAYVDEQYDFLLGMLEYRDGINQRKLPVREALINRIKKAKVPNDNHNSLVRLALNKNQCAIATTNFDLLLEKAAKNHKIQIASYSLGAIPRPSDKKQFSGVMHLHGKLPSSIREFPSLIVTHLDFGEYYFSRDVVPSFIFYASRIFHIVLVGYSAKDPPMRYLFNAVSSDREIHPEVKRHYVILPKSEAQPWDKHAWDKRGFNVVAYENEDGSHDNLRKLLKQWADISPHNSDRINSETVKRSFSKKFEDFTEYDKTILRYIYNQGNLEEWTAFYDKYVSICGPSLVNFILQLDKERKKQGTAT